MTTTPQLTPNQISEMLELLSKAQDTLGIAASVSPEMYECSKVASEIQDFFKALSNGSNA